MSRELDRKVAELLGWTDVKDRLVFGKWTFGSGRIFSPQCAN